VDNFTTNLQKIAEEYENKEKIQKLPKNYPGEVSLFSSSPTVVKEFINVIPLDIEKIVEEISEEDETSNRMKNIKKPVDILDFSLLERMRDILAEVARLDSTQVEIPFYPFKVATQTVNTLVGATNIGKSTLATALMNELSVENKTCLISVEESDADIGRRLKKIMMSKSGNLNNMNIFGMHSISKEALTAVFRKLNEKGFKYVILDYVNPHNIDLMADLAEKIDVCYQWLIELAQEFDMAVFAFIQANTKAYNPKIDVIAHLLERPSDLATYADGGIRAIVKSYTAVMLYKVREDRFLIPCKGRQDDVEKIFGWLHSYNVRLEDYKIEQPFPKMSLEDIKGKTDKEKKVQEQRNQLVKKSKVSKPAAIVKKPKAKTEYSVDEKREKAGFGKVEKT